MGLALSGLFFGVGANKVADYQVGNGASVFSTHCMVACAELRLAGLRPLRRKLDPGLSATVGGGAGDLWPARFVVQDGDYVALADVPGPLLGRLVCIVNKNGSCIQSDRFFQKRWRKHVQICLDNTDR